jgi:hypothetical protein
LNLSRNHHPRIERDRNVPVDINHWQFSCKIRTMIYAAKFFLALIALVSVAAVYKFPLKKVDNREFVAGILARAAKGMK